jgi:acyl-CoA reductase-like NAD-dependent aldehyde dehydrogenase
MPNQRIIACAHTQAGGIAINECVLHMTECGLPFGGRGASGMGSYHGRHGFEAFSHSKSALYKWDITSVEFMR